MRSRTPVLATTLFLVACFSTGCEGGVFGGGGSGSGATSDGDHFLVFSPGLQAIDPRNPTRVLAIDSIGAHDFVIEGAFDVGSKRLLDPHRTRLVYAKGDRLLSVSLVIERTGGVAHTPVPEELMSFPSAVEGVDVEEDYSEGNGVPTYVVELASGFEVFTEQAGVPTLPLVFPGTPEIALREPGTGAFAGWLALADGFLTRVERDLSVTILAAASEVEELGNAGDVFLAVDGQLMSFELETGVLTDLNLNVEPDEKFFRDSRVHEGLLYFAVSNGPGFEFEIFSTDLDGPITSLVWGGHAGLTALTVLETNLVRRTQEMAHAREWLFRCALDGSGCSPVVETLLSYLTMPFGDSFIDGDTVYYNIEDVGAYVSELGAEPVHYENGTWLTPQPRDELGLNQPLEVERLLLLTRDGNDPAVLSSLDPDDLGAPPLFLGLLDSSVSSFVTIASFGDARLGFGRMGSGGPVQWDVFFFDTKRAGSLVRVTNTPGVSETGLF